MSSEKHNGDAEQKPEKKRLTQSEYAKMSSGCKGKKSTDKEIHDRVMEMADWLLRYPLASKFKVREQFCPKFDIKWRQCDRYVAEARAINKKRIRMSPEAAAEFGDAILIDLLCSNSDKNRLGAIKVWQERHGYAAPTKTSLVNPDGSALFVPLHVDPKEIVGDQNGMRQIEDKKPEKEEEE